MDQLQIIGNQKTAEPYCFQIATAADFALLSEYLKVSEFAGPIDMQIGRPAPANRVYETLSESFTTYWMPDENGSPVASLTLLFREVFIRREKRKTLILTDFKISPVKGALRGVSTQLLDVLESEKLRTGADNIFTILSYPQQQLLHSFIRPRTTRINQPRFYMVRKFIAVGVHGKFPELNEDQISISLAPAARSDIPKLIEYMNQKTRAKLLGREHTLASLHREFSTDKDFDPSDFVIAKDHSGNLVGSMALVSSDRFHLSRIRRYHGFSKSLKAAFAWLSLFGLTERLPRVNDLFRLKYLTHLYADNADIFISLVRHAYRIKRKGEVIAYNHFDDDPMSVPTYPMICSEFPFSLYCILKPGEPAPMYIRQSPLEPPPDIDPTMI